MGRDCPFIGEQGGLGGRRMEFISAGVRRRWGPSRAVRGRGRGASRRCARRRSGPSRRQPAAEVGALPEAAAAARSEGTRGAEMVRRLEGRRREVGASSGGARWRWEPSGEWCRWRPPSGARWSWVHGSIQWEGGRGAGRASGGRPGRIDLVDGGSRRRPATVADRRGPAAAACAGEGRPVAARAGEGGGDGSGGGEGRTPAAGSATGSGTATGSGWESRTILPGVGGCGNR